MVRLHLICEGCSVTSVEITTLSAVHWQVLHSLQEAEADVRQASPVLAANLDQVCEAACTAAQRLHSSKDASSLQAVCGVPSLLLCFAAHSSSRLRFSRCM